MSWQMSAIALYLRMARKRRYATTSRAAKILLEPKTPSAPPSSLTNRFSVTRSKVDPFDVYVVGSGPRPRSSASVIYLHGGAYVGEIRRQHWSLIADIVAEVGVDVWVPIYGLAPHYHAADAIGLMHKVLYEASSNGPTYLMGDSAGGGLALASTLSWQQTGGVPPVGLTLMAPWLDAGLRNPGIAAVEPCDPWLSTPGLHVIAQAWADDIPLDDPRVSPLFGDLSIVPHIDLYVGDRDITVADCRVLREKAPAGRVRYHEAPGALHVYPLLPAPEGRAARHEMLENVDSAIARV
jgi:acetyl esterase/lipase